ncbi:MAG: GAF domain-containing sensor histidine kinase [Thermoleophilaceae bacterium]
MRTLDEHTLRRLIDVGRALTSDLDIEVVLRRVLHTARELTKARYAALGILDEEREGLERFHTVGLDERTRARIGEPPHGRGVLGVLIRDPRPLRLDDVGSHPSSFGFPPGHPPMAGFLGVPIIVRGQAFGNLYLSEKAGGGAFDEADEQAVVVLAEWAAVAIENAQLYTRAEGRRAELERAVRGFEATTAISGSLAGEIELERVLELVAKRGRALVEARTFGVLLEDGGELRVAAVAGADRDAEGARMPLDSLPGQVLRSRRSERVADVSARLRGSFEPLEVSARSAVLVPLAFRGHAYGVLCAIDRTKRGPEFDTEDLALLEGFAAAAATAIATARSVERELLRHSIEVQEHERRRWARELHDQTLQALGALQLLLSTALRAGDAESAARQAIDLLGSEIDGLRAIINDLRPAALDELGTGPAIEALATRVAEATGMAVEASVELSGRHRPEIESTIYRVVQEGLTNAAKHARAAHVRVLVTEGDAAIAIEIADDGTGFDPVAGTSGFGLLGMRERLALAGGRLEIESSPGHGTTLRAVVAGPPAERAAG